MKGIIFNTMLLKAVLAASETEVGEKKYKTLRAGGEVNNLYMGSALNLRHESDSKYTQTIAREYDIVTAENACKWGSIRPNQWTYNLDDCVNHLKFAIENNQKFRGHNLVWGVWNPDWLTNFSGGANALE